MSNQRRQPHSRTGSNKTTSEEIHWSFDSFAEVDPVAIWTGAKHGLCGQLDVDPVDDSAPRELVGLGIKSLHAEVTKDKIAALAAEVNRKPDTIITGGDQNFKESFDAWCVSQGIFHRVTARYAPWRNPSENAVGN